MSKAKPRMPVFASCSDMDFYLPLWQALQLLGDDAFFLEADEPCKTAALAVLTAALADAHSVLRWGEPAARPERYSYLRERIQVAYHQPNPHWDVQITYDPYTKTCYPTNAT
jgi:hypothetical protein